jgi:hypothetical protein
MNHTPTSVRSYITLHKSIPGARMARIPMDHGYVLSMVGGPSLYGDGIDTWEVAIIADSTGELLYLPHGDQVLGGVTIDEIVEFLNLTDMNIMDKFREALV